MLPLRDNVHRYRSPKIVIVICVACAVVFAREVMLQFNVAEADWRDVERGGSALDALIARSGLVAEKVAAALIAPSEWYHHPIDAARYAVLPLFTSLFLHAGAAHILSNLWFLWVFGRTVEDRVGSGRFLLLYLLCGAAAGLLHVFFMSYSRAVEDYAEAIRYHGFPRAPLGLVERLEILANEPRLRVGAPPFAASRMPTIGASGAISGVLGAYCIIAPRARILMMIPPLVFMNFEVPAAVFIGAWLLTQIFGLWDSLGAPLFAGVGGIAYGAHFGGFVAGVAAGFAFRRRHGERLVTMEIR